MRLFRKQFASIPRRAVAVFLSCAIFASMFLTVLTGTILFLNAGNTTAADALNTAVTVQSINMLPVDVGQVHYTENDVLQDMAYSRTQFESNCFADDAFTENNAATASTPFIYDSGIKLKNETDFVKSTYESYGETLHNYTSSYLNISVASDESVTYSIKETKSASGESTTFLSTMTESGQKINLRENPWLMLFFESRSARANGYIYFSLTKDGTTYYFDTNNPSSSTAVSTDSDDLHKSRFSFYQIVTGSYTIGEDGSNDFSYGHMGDYTIDFYKYLYAFINNSSYSLSSYWPNWSGDSADNYLQIHYISHTVASESPGADLKSGASIKWKACALGREALSGTDSLVPREDSMFGNTSTLGEANPYYKSEDARAAMLDDGVMVFRNPSPTAYATYYWNIRRYVNIQEFSTLVFDAEYETIDTHRESFDLRITVTGRNATQSTSTEYSSPWILVGNYNSPNSTDDDTAFADNPQFDFDYVLAKFSDCDVTADLADRYRDIKIDFKSTVDFYVEKKSGAGYNFLPTDDLVGIETIMLTLPPGAKLSVSKFNFAVENVFSPSTTENTIYPWASVEPTALPKVGTPATTADLDYTNGFEFYSEYNNHIYAVFDSAVSWEDAKESCESYGGHLATITTSGEQSFITGMIDKVAKVCWVGGTDKDSEGTWKWVTDESFGEYTHWTSDEPNNYNDNEHYMGIYASGNGYTWNDFSNTSTTVGAFICEWDSASSFDYTTVPFAENGAYAATYEWKATETPLTQYKFDLLSLMDQAAVYSNETGKEGQFAGYKAEENLAGYYRTLSGSSYFTSDSANVFHRSFKRRDIGQSTLTTDNNNNYLSYIDVPTTRYLYYSYELISSDNEPLDENASAGIYFKLWDNASGTIEAATPARFLNSAGYWGSVSYYQLYLDHNGLGLNPCDKLMSDDTHVSEQSKAREMCSTATARTGVIDLWSLGFNDSVNQTLKLEELCFYVSGPNTKLHVNYLFFGSETLNETYVDSNNTTHNVKDTVARNSGDAFPWSVSHDTFTSTTTGTTTAKFTFANRVNILEDLQDRVKWNLKNNGNAAPTEVDVEKKLGGDIYGATACDIQGNGSVTVTVASEDHYQQVGTSFDHIMAIDLTNSDTDLDSLRYINYSVEADPGMRWAILFKEHSDKMGDDTGASLRTWSDALTQNSVAAGTTNSPLTTSDAYAQSFMRDMDADPGFTNNKVDYDIFHRYFYSTPVVDGNVQYTDAGYINYSQVDSCAKDTAWGAFTVPGSETGCFDLSQVMDTGADGYKISTSWKNIVAVYLIAYKDPSIKSDDGTSEISGSVTFNYLYLTSEPLTGDSYGVPPMSEDTVYSWPFYWDNTHQFSCANGDRVEFTTAGEKSKDSNGYTYHDFNISYSNNGCGNDGEISRSDGQNLFNDTYSLYYAFTFKDGNGKVVTPPMAVAIYGKDSAGKECYVYRGRTGHGSFYYTHGSMISNSTRDFDSQKGLLMPLCAEIGSVEMGVVSSFSSITHIRVYYDTSKYSIGVEYCVIDLSQDSSYSPKPTFYKSITKLASNKKIADFSDYVKTTVASDKVKLITGGVHNQGYAGTRNDIVVDLSVTPYLYYSIEYEPNITGTFALRFKSGDGTECVFYRNGANSAVGSKDLVAETSLSNGAPNISANKFMQTSESGCINLKEWCEDSLPKNSDGTVNYKITFNYLWILLSDAKENAANYKYMYFGAACERTIDLIPSEAGGNLSGSGVPTRAWSYDFEARFAEMEPAEGWDSYIEESKKIANGSVVNDPIVKVDYVSDQTNDGFNDLLYTDEGNGWSFHSVSYGLIENSFYPGGARYDYVGTALNEMSGLTIDLNDMRYLHFSLTQEEGSYTTFVLQANDQTSTNEVRNKSAGDVKPWLSSYNTNSTAGQLMHVTSETQQITFYKDLVVSDTYCKGNFEGVIDLKSWFNETNGFNDIISLERVRFYTTDAYGNPTDVHVKYFYLSSSSGSSYSVTFDNNIKENEGEHRSLTMQVLKNANDQFVSDTAVEEYKTRSGYTFMGWHTDEAWESYFDIDTMPVEEDMTLFAGWIDNSLVQTDEVDFLEQTPTDGTTVIKDEDGVYINNAAGDESISVHIPVNAVYSITQMPSLYIGFDTDKTSQGAKIALDVKSLGTHEFDLLGSAFGEVFLTEDGLLTAAPYDEEVSLYSRLVADELFPITEYNPHGYVYIKSATVMVPAGVSMRLRYFTAAQSMSTEIMSTAVVAPNMTLDSSVEPIDLLSLDYTTQKWGSSTLTDAGKVPMSGTTIELTSAQYSSTEGSALDHGSPNSGVKSFEIPIDAADHRYLYFDISQSANSKVTFAIYSGTIQYSYTDDSGETVFATHNAENGKFLSFFDASKNALGSNLDLSNSSISEDQYLSGNRSGAIDLYTWYKDALNGISDASKSNFKVTAVFVDGIRLYTYGSANATFNYFAIGGVPQTAVGNTGTTVIAPNMTISGKTVEPLDFLNPGDDTGYIEQLNNTDFDALEGNTVDVYNTNYTLCQAKISGIDTGYATLGSLYGLGDEFGYVSFENCGDKYLYFHVTQSDNSYTTFNIWCSVKYRYTDKDNNVVTGSHHPAKWSTFYDHSKGALGSQDDMVNGGIPSWAYAAGSFSGAINITEWYSDALKDSYFPNLKDGTEVTVTGVNIKGIRLYVTNKGTDATFNYLAIGGEPLKAVDSATVVYPIGDGEATASSTFAEGTQFGQHVELALDELTDCEKAFDPTVVFRGWTFTEGGEPVYWNPYPQNRKEATDANPGGAWSKEPRTYTTTDGAGNEVIHTFSQNRRDVVYQFTPETTTIYPVFGEVYLPKLSLKLKGNGTVNVSVNAQEGTDYTTAQDIATTYGDDIILTATGDSFKGWYEGGKLVSTTRTYRLTMCEDAVVTAEFATDQNVTVFEPYVWQADSAIVWLQSQTDGLKAGTDFYLQSLNNTNSEVLMTSCAISNIADLEEGTQIVCYWQIENGQMVQAVAPNGYHFEKLLSDGTTVPVSNENTYAFAVSADIKLICVANGMDTPITSVIINEYAIDFDRDSNIAPISAQAILAEGEEIVSCGAVIAVRPSCVRAPSYRSAESSVIAASAWNSTTGQFSVDVPFKQLNRAQYLRAYVIVRDTSTGAYSLRYSDFVTKSF